MLLLKISGIQKKSVFNNPPELKSLHLVYVNLEEKEDCLK